MPNEQTARDFYNGGGGSYPPDPAQRSTDTGWPAPGLLELAQAATAPAPALQAAPAAVKPVDPTPPQTPEEVAEAMYGVSAPTRGNVDWQEPPAQAVEYELEAPRALLDQSDEGRAAMQRLREGFAEAGAGRSLAKEIFEDAVLAQQGAFVPQSQVSAEAELRRTFGTRYDTKIAAAKGMVQRVAQRCPEIVPFLERTGLGNDPAFIQKVAAAAARQRRSAK